MSLCRLEMKAFAGWLMKAFAGWIMKAFAGCLTRTRTMVMATMNAISDRSATKSDH